jgi:hypothetical protein
LEKDIFNKSFAGDSLLNINKELKQKISKIEDGIEILNIKNTELSEKNSKYKQNE